MWTYCAKCKQEEILSTKKKNVKKEKRKEENTKWRKKQKVGWGVEIGNFVQHTSSPFSLSFSLHFVEIEFWWIRRGNNWASPLFSLHPPFNQTSFPPLFFIFPKIHPTKVKKIYSQIFNPQDCFFNLFTLLNFLKTFTFHNFSFFFK